MTILLIVQLVVCSDVLHRHTQCTTCVRTPHTRVLLVPMLHYKTQSHSRDGRIFQCSGYYFLLRSNVSIHPVENRTKSQSNVTDFMFQIGVKKAVFSTKNHVISTRKPYKDPVRYITFVRQKRDVNSGGCVVQWGM